MTREESLLARRQRLMGGAYRLFYDRPLHIVRGEGVWLFDAAGRRYLDAYNNVPHVGHCHPRVVEAICTQAAALNTHTRYLHEGVLDYAEMLLSRFPPGLEIAMFTCTGSEANELALRIARLATDRPGIIAVENGYHGNTWLTAQISDEEPGEPREDRIAIVPSPDTFRGTCRGPDAGARYAQAVAQAADRLRERGYPPGAFIMDTVLSSNGLPDIPADWLPEVVAVVRAAGAVFIADEVQPGFGRMGGHFWGFERLGVVPDIVTMGKPMANGHPAAAVVTSQDLVDGFGARASYFNTFGGNPVSCAAARAVLEVLDEERLPENAREVGQYLRAGLEALAEQHAAIGDIRGSGLFQGVDLVSDRATRAPAGKLAQAVHNGMRDRGVLIGTIGAHDNVLKIRPPMVFSREHADLLLECLDEALAN